MVVFHEGVEEHVVEGDFFVVDLVGVPAVDYHDDVGDGLLGVGDERDEGFGDKLLLAGVHLRDFVAVGVDLVDPVPLVGARYGVGDGGHC